MKILKAIGLFAVLLLGSVNFLFAQKTEKAFADGEVLVKFKSGAPDTLIRRTNAALGSESLETLGDLSWVRVRLPAGMTVGEAVARYRQSGEVEAAQPNFYYRLAQTPNDPQYANAGMYGLGKISAPAAWDLTTGSASVVVAVIDTGINYNHEDLSANMWRNPGEIEANGIDDDGNGFIDDYYGWDFYFNDSNPQEEFLHGTHVAGTIGAVGNNNLGVVGVNWTVRLMAIKIYNLSGDATSAMLINAYNYVRMMKNRGVNIRVTNNSYAGCNEACGYDQATKEALEALGDAGVLNVFAAGNNNLNIDSFPYPSANAPGYPARYDSPLNLVVASSTSTDARSGFSNWGTASVDLAAPGSGIWSTNASSYGANSGTSMASPHAAGAAALLAAYNPNLSAASLKATLLNTVDPLAAWNGIVKTGGRLNVAAALQNQTVCDFQLSQTELFAPTKGGVFTVSVNAPANCDYAVKSEAKWLSVMSASPLSGNGSVSFRVAVNQQISRTGTIRIGDRQLSVRQSRN